MPGAGDVSVFASPAFVAAAREWAITIQPYDVRVEAAGKVRVSVPQGDPYRSRHEVDGWLAAHPAVALHLTWRDADGARSYSAWPRMMQERLWRLVDEAQGDKPSSTGAQMPVSSAMRDASNTTTGLELDEAREFYLAAVARTLRLQIDAPAGTDFHEDELEALFSSRSILSFGTMGSDERQTGITPARIHQ